MNEHGLPCRRCNEVTKDVVTIYGRDIAGALRPKTAQCRGPCPGSTPSRQDRPRAARTRTAIRPGLCQACDRDIVPGDVIAGAGDLAFHYECSPNETSRDRSWQRERDQARRP